MTTVRTLLGSISPPALPAGVTFEDRGDQLILTATTDLRDFASGQFVEPVVSIGLPLPATDDTVYLGHGWTQFAMPMRATPTRPFDLTPASNLFSPAAVLPLAVASEGRSCLLAPLDAWHDQLITFDQDADGVRGFRWGWHGDLREIPAETTATLGVYEAPTIDDCYRAWAADLRARHPIARYGIDDPILTTLSYWTDNGAAYWYRTEQGETLPESLTNKLRELDELAVPVGVVELDSWFYPHQTLRPVAEIGYPEEVPPTGMLRWEARPDVVPDGLDDLNRRLGERPMILHSRHIAAASPYVEEDPESWWVDRTAHPKDPNWFGGWLDAAKTWGATCMEQDWMLMVWFGCRDLRAAPGRATEWQRTLNRLAAERGMSLIFCMATPGDYFTVAECDRVIAVRTCDDYRFADDPARLWRWYLTNNVLAGSLDVPVFKDCFFTSAEPGTDPLDGDPHAEVEAVLSAFSAGIVGIGDRIGRTDTGIIGRLIDDQGYVVTSETPMAMRPESFFDAADAGRLTWAEAWDGDHRYVLALHLDDADQPLAGHLDLGDDVLVYGWRSGAAAIGDQISTLLEPRDWALFVCCPLTGEPGERTATIGDPRRYATRGGSGSDATPSDRLRWLEGEGLLPT
ncbi:MAG: hypothetical protein AAGC53_17445 [Actinomycetota bacterium]